MKTLKLDITELEIDEQQNKISTNSYDRYFDYDEIYKTQIILPQNSLYRQIAFNEVSSPFALVIVSDKKLNVLVNDFEITNTKMVLLNTYIDSLEIANVDLLPATVSVYIWGKQE